MPGARVAGPDEQQGQPLDPWGRVSGPPREPSLPAALPAGSYSSGQRDLVL